MPRTPFNRLPSRQKWEKYKSMKGKWYCPKCRKQTDAPYRASPFHGAQVCCGNCDHTLTRRTGGGQSDPFNWHYGKPPAPETPMDFINYQARGTLFAAHRTHPGKFIILVNTGSDTQPWVVSTYNNGATTWESGTYKSRHEDALKEFNEQVRDRIGLLELCEMWQLQGTA